MGVASIPDCKYHRARDEWDALRTIRKMDVAKSTTEDFVTVVSVESQPPSENFVTVLSIGSSKKTDEPAPSAKSTKWQSDGANGPLEEEVEVYRLPGERLGFGLKFEGGNKTSERVRRLFVQSCAEQSPASRAKCSWGTLGEGDEVLSIDGVPVTHMTRLDCVRRLQESQLVIKLMVRCRGALRPEVVSAEKKSSPEKSKVPPELPSQPPPVPPRKLRQARGLADGEANPSPAKKSWNGSRVPQSTSQSSSQSSSQNGSPNSQPAGQSCSKSTSFESCDSSPKTVNGPAPESPRATPKERSPELAKSKQEPPEAMVYMDARSQCGSTHGSTSDDTGSSMSTVIDRFSTSDRVSTISTASTASTTSEQPNEFSRIDRDFDQLSKAICPLDNLDNDYTSTPPDYLLRRLASSEAVTHVESRGEVEKITAVVAPNTVLIEETITFQPPLSFQDAPLSYGHEARPDLFYTADLAADSTTHFRPIKDDVELVERVNSINEEFQSANSSPESEKRKEAAGVRGPSKKTPPPLPARNHVNRVSVNQSISDLTADPRSQKQPDQSTVDRCDSQDAPVLPPKPLPRRDVKVRRKRPPPPPPPPPTPPPPPPPPTIAPRVEVKSSSLPESRETSFEKEKDRSSRPNAEAVPSEPDEAVVKAGPGDGSKTSDRQDASVNSTRTFKRFTGEDNDAERKGSDETDDPESMENYDPGEDGGHRTNKVLEIIEIRKAKAFSPRRTNAVWRGQDAANDKIRSDESKVINCTVHSIAGSSDQKPEGSKGESKTAVRIAAETEDSEEDVEQITKFNEPITESDDKGCARSEGLDRSKEPGSPCKMGVLGRRDREGNEDPYRCGDRNAEEVVEDDDTSDESDDGDYYWQSNLATIGEEEETNSLEYTDANKESSDCESIPTEKAECQESPGKRDVFVANARNDEVENANRAANFPEAVAANLHAETVNGRMDNCGGGQRLPPDGDEFPTAYQEFGSSSQQYRFVTTSTATARTSTMIGNGRLVSNENASFMSNEGYKLLESNAIGTAGIILPDDRVAGLASVDNVCQETKSTGLPSIEINGKMNVENVCQEANDDAKPYISDDFADEFVKKSGPVIGYSGYGNHGNGNTIVSEKKIEITGCYHKDGYAPVIEEQQVHTEKDALDTPPPLPLTGPPKMEANCPPTYARNVPILGATATPRKFSLNGELWRQDDKSERSVRDKIAMFSSQSSLDGPLFPNSVAVASATSGGGRRLSKYKSTEDVCCDEKSPGQKERVSFFADRTQSSLDLTDSVRNVNQEPGRKYGQQLSSCITQSVPFASPTIRASKTFPVVPQKPASSMAATSINPFEASPFPKSQLNDYSLATTTHSSPHSVSLKPVATTALSRATSFSGSTIYAQDRTSTTNDVSTGPHITRTNSLASTFKRPPAEDNRRTSLDQLIEQRRRSISKLRGLVIPEKEAIPIDAPIVDLPEIKSRESILLHQLAKVNIQDKWGSQSSLASNASTASIPLKATTSFKMPAPQIHSKYSPAFKRKTLAVYGSSSTNLSANSSRNSSTNGNTAKTHPVATTMTPSTLSDPPKSLESICSPTRSDYSFEFTSTASSPEGLRSRPKIVQRKTRMDYDDSDNDSAVSSSQSSISRGFSPPMSPVPSERSTVSSERSHVSTETYPRRSIISSSPTRTYPRESSVEFLGKSNNLADRTFISERSSSSSSSSDFRSPTSESSSRNSQIPQRQLKRSNSTDTNCSTSSTLTSGSQASAESLSRRVLKPQSVEAINRKNILASARCRSGRDLNGSPLIQRKFHNEECRSTAGENGDGNYQETHAMGTVSSTQEVKIAYIEVTDSFAEDDPLQKESERSKMSPKGIVVSSIVKASKFETMEPSNDLRMWVRTEAKALTRIAGEKITNSAEKKSADTNNSPTNSTLKTNKSTVIDERQNNYSVDLSSSRRNAEHEIDTARLELSKERCLPSIPPKKPLDDQNDLLTILTTKSRSRSAIHMDDGSYGPSKCQMSLEDILTAKGDTKASKTQTLETRTERHSVMPNAQTRSLWDSRGSRYARGSSAALNESWSDEKSPSKIPSLRKFKHGDSSGDEVTEIEKSKSMLSKIPLTRNLGRRSVSVTDMKKALEVNCSTSPNQTTGACHNRFPSLDSSVDENVSSVGTDVDADRCCSEQFGSISSLASSTSLISQQELAQLVEEASLDEARGAHDVIVVLLHKENPTGSVGITLAGGADCEIKEITVHRVLAHSIADKDGRVQRGDRILSINGRSTQGLTHRESIAVLKQPRTEIVLVVSRARTEEGCKLKSRTASVETIIEGFETNDTVESTAWGPPSVVAVYKDGAGLGFSLEGGRDSPLGDRPLIIKKIFTGGAAEKTGALKAGDQLLELNGYDVTRMSRIEAWSLMKKLHDGEVNLLVRHPATKSS